MAVIRELCTLQTWMSVHQKCRSVWKVRPVRTPKAPTDVAVRQASTLSIIPATVKPRLNV